MKYARKTFVQKLRQDIAEMYLSVHPLIISFFSFHFTPFPAGPRSATPWAAYQSNMEGVRESGFSVSLTWIGLHTGKGCGTSLVERLSWVCLSPCEKMLATDAWLRWQCRWVRPGCPSKCDTPRSWGHEGTIGNGGDGGRGFGIAFWLVTRHWAQCAWASLYVWRIHEVKVFGLSELFIILPGSRGQKKKKKWVKNLFEHLLWPPQKINK